MNITELTKWVGKHVRTEDESMFNCGEWKNTPSERHSPRHRGFCGHGDKFGGEGWVVKFEIEEHGRVYLYSDEGLSWPVTSKTVIVEVPSRRPMDEEARASILMEM